jgi:exopolysaccharide biosynthesis polyprenyl glycosylphosphotransferase
MPRLGLLTLLGRLVLNLPKPAWAGIDAAIALGALWIGYALSPWDTSDPAVQIAIWKAWLVSAAAIVVSGMISGLYEDATLLKKRRIATRTALTAVAAVCLAFVVISGALYSPMSRRVAVWMGTVYLAGSIALRAGAHVVLSRYRLGLLIVGTGPSARVIASTIEASRVKHYHVVGLVATEPLATKRQPIDGHKVLGDVSNLQQLCADYGVRELIIGSEDQDKPQIMEAALACLGLGCRVTNESTFSEKAFGEVPVSHIGPEWFLFADLGVYREEFISTKRAIDFALAAMGMVLTMPLWPLIALVIKLDSLGPVFHRQERIGQGGRGFDLYKFRTMRVGAEPNGSVWAAERDPRITRVGKWLRRSHLDELPQLWNVLRGQMSLVGPRPERPDIVQDLATHIPYYNQRHLIKPGLTGWAQINFRYGASVADARKKLQLDLYYIKNMSLELDALIILRTIGKVVSGAV